MSGAIQTSRPTTLKRYFVGFNSQDAKGSGHSTRYDIDLINGDLMNAFNTRVGERVMRPDWGCKLWDYLMEPLTPVLRDQVIEEATRIVGLDTRLVMQSVNVFDLDVGFRIEIISEYLPWRVIASFSATFDNAEQVYFGSSV